MELFLNISISKQHSFSVVSTDEMVENNQEEEDDANEVAEHSKLDIRDHAGAGAEL